MNENKQLKSEIFLVNLEFILINSIIKFTFSKGN